MKCPHCNRNVDVRLIKAPDDMQQQSPATIDESDVGELLRAIDERALDGASLEFVQATKARYKQYKEKIRMSEKQMSWLRDLAQGDGF